LVTLGSIIGYQPGDTAEDFSLKGIDGKMHSLSDYNGAKGFIVVFTCNHCPFAVMYEDRINDLAKKYAGLGYRVIAINPNDPAVKPDDSYDNMILRAKEKDFRFDYLIDEGQKIYPKFGATKTPHAFLLDNKRVVKYIGAIDDNAEDANLVTIKYLENAIAAVERGENPNPSVTKAIGCSIKKK
jgi:peroxiredoxin